MVRRRQRSRPAARSCSAALRRPEPRGALAAPPRSQGRRRGVLPRRGRAAAAAAHHRLSRDRFLVVSARNARSALSGRVDLEPPAAGDDGGRRAVGGAPGARDADHGAQHRFHGARRHLRGRRARGLRPALVADRRAMGSAGAARVPAGAGIWGHRRGRRANRTRVAGPPAVPGRRGRARRRPRTARARRADVPLPRLLAPGLPDAGGQRSPAARHAGGDDAERVVVLSRGRRARTQRIGAAGARRAPALRHRPVRAPAAAWLPGEDRRVLAAVGLGVPRRGADHRRVESSPAAPGVLLRGRA